MAGAISYPVFLSHYLVGAVIATASGLVPGWPLFFAAIGPTLALSWLLVVVVERPVQTFRQQLRANHGN
jgi:peptidoglycan/LPS O-acetylase OafA/YrhL